MTVPAWLISDSYVLILAVLLLGFSVGKKQKTRPDMTFISLLLVLLVLVTGDILSKCNALGTPGLPAVLSRIGNYVIFAGDPFGYLVTLAYIDSWIHDPDRKSRKIVYLIISAYVALNFILITVSDLTGSGWFYSFPDNVYTRGPLFVVRGVCNMVLCLVIGIYVVARKREIRSDYTGYVIAFPVIVFLSGMLQVFVGGASYEYAGTIFSCLMLYICVQNRSMDTDYLTGLLNRKGIDEELQYRIRHQDSPLTGYMLDLDFFKNINDVCGHESGDEALKTMAEMLRKAFGRKASIGRYGGDEFLIIDNSSPAEAEKHIRKLANLCDSFNTFEDKPYRLGFSVGHETYTREKYPDLDSFIRSIDREMYREKDRHHALRSDGAKDTK